MTNLNLIKFSEIKGESQKQLISNVDSIIKEIESGKYDYLENVLDINYLIDREKNYKGARLLVSWGGPNIWIDTFTKEVQGYWGGDQYIKGYFGDELGLDDYCEEIYKY